MSAIILGIESSCDDTSAAIVADGILMSNVIASQSVHEAYGGVVPELASRSHQENIVPVVAEAIRQAGIDKKDLSAIAFTRGPGLLGSLMVGVSFAKSLAIALNIPIIDVNHLHAHALAQFIRTDDKEETPAFPYLCLLVSGGNSQIILVKSPSEMEILGRTIDDAAGEAFDKCAKALGLPYPGGPHIDALAAKGNNKAFRFAKPKIAGYDYSFSGLKTSFLYTLRDGAARNPDFIDQNLADLAASLQHTIVEILIDKLRKAAKATGVRHLAIGGGVAANSEVRQAVEEMSLSMGITPHIPARKFTTDNAAMVATAAYFKYLKKDFCTLDAPPYARVTI